VQPEAAELRGPGQGAGQHGPGLADRGGALGEQGGRVEDDARVRAAVVRPARTLLGLRPVPAQLDTQPGVPAPQPARRPAVVGVQEVLDGVGLVALPALADAGGQGVGARGVRGGARGPRRLLERRRRER